jgi:hypothetical protein
MSKKFLLFTAILFIALPAFAQTTNSPVISGVSANSNSYQLGNPITMTWSRSGNFPTSDSYFVFMKDKPDQVLGSHNSINGIHYSSVAYWQPTLAYPTFTFSSPLVPSGTYYIELDFVDPTGTVITTATSKSFEITPLMVNVNPTTITTTTSVSTPTPILKSSSIQLSDLNPSLKQSITLQLEAIINKLIQLVAELTQTNTQ